MARYELLPEEKLRIAQAALDTRLRALYQTELEAIADEDGSPGAGNNARVRERLMSEQVSRLREKLSDAETAVGKRAKELQMETDEYLKRDRRDTERN